MSVFAIASIITFELSCVKELHSPSILSIFSLALKVILCYNHARSVADDHPNLNSNILLTLQYNSSRIPSNFILAFDHCYFSSLFCLASLKSHCKRVHSIKN